MSCEFFFSVSSERGFTIKNLNLEEEKNEIKNLRLISKKNKFILKKKGKNSFYF
jgi:hypothetical protein